MNCDSFAIEKGPHSSIAVNNIHVEVLLSFGPQRRIASHPPLPKISTREVRKTNAHKALSNDAYQNIEGIIAAEERHSAINRTTCIILLLISCIER